MARKKKKKYDHDKNPELIKLRAGIAAHSSELQDTRYIHFDKKPTGSCYDLYVHEGKMEETADISSLVGNKDTIAPMKAVKVPLNLNDRQKLIIGRWENAWLKMYNATLRYFKDCRRNGVEAKLNLSAIRKILAVEEQAIIRNSTHLPAVNGVVPATVIPPVPVHCLDGAIAQSISNHKSALTNLARNHIKHFRMRYLRFNAKQKILSIPQDAFSTKIESFYSSALGVIDYEKYDEKKPNDDLKGFSMTIIREKEIKIKRTPLTNEEKEAEKQFKIRNKTLKAEGKKTIRRKKPTVAAQQD